jgi:hypothetical protein
VVTQLRNTSTGALVTDITLALEQARERVRFGWVAGDLAVTVNGKRCDPADPEAIGWCLTGAVAADGDTETYERVFELLASALQIKNINLTATMLALMEWNDAQSDKQAVIQAFDDAIALYEKEQASFRAKLRRR